MTETKDHPYIQNLKRNFAEGRVNRCEFLRTSHHHVCSVAESLLDFDHRREVLAKLVRLMQEDGPIVQPLWRKVFSFWDKRVKGFQKRPSLYLFANEWAIET